MSLQRRCLLQRATDVAVTQNGLWLNWARYVDEVALERGLLRCEEIALSGGGDVRTPLSP
ncbi:MAG: hypothetical protein MK191_05310 [Acidimicrobiales bacterium]|jgi:hypothetical protein|nr:hypothetical protein [Acidimicrobiales bacterium]